MANGGQTSVDPIAASPLGAVGGQPVQPMQAVDATGAETMLMTLPMASADNCYATVHLTNRRLIVVKFPRLDGHPTLVIRPGRECPEWGVHRSTAKSSGPTQLRWS